MRRGNTIRLAILAALLTSTFLVFNTTASTGAKSCKESAEQCCKKKRGGSVKTGWANLSQQFFSSI